MQLVIGNSVLLDVVLNIFLRPVGQWIDLINAVVRLVELDLLKCRTRHSLCTTQSRHPCIQPPERTIQWLYFSDGAAFFSIFDRLTERIKSLLALKLLDRLRLWEIGLDGDTIFAAHLIHHFIGLFVESARIQRKDLDRGIQLHHDIDEHHIFRAKR
jgi:hypothetical protein